MRRSYRHRQTVAAGGDPTMRPARPIHLLRLFHSHRRQAASHSPVPGPKFWVTSNLCGACSGRRSDDEARTADRQAALVNPSLPDSCCLPQSGARHETLGDINPVGGGLPAMRPARPIHLLRLSHSYRQQSCLPQVQIGRRRYCAGSWSRPLMVVSRLFQRPSLMP